MTRQHAKMTPEEYAQYAADALRKRRRPVSAEHRRKIQEGTRAFWTLARKTLEEQEAQQGLPL